MIALSIILLICGFIAFALGVVSDVHKFDIDAKVGYVIGSVLVVAGLVMFFVNVL